MKLTDRQREVLWFINEHRRVEQSNPTVGEIATYFGWASPNASQRHIDLLECKGVIRKRPGKSRGYVVEYPWSHETPSLKVAA